MISINSSDIVKKPSYVTNPADITFIRDAKKQITKSVVIPFALYEKLREKIEDELYIMKNEKALSQASYDAFLEIEEVIEEVK